MVGDIGRSCVYPAEDTPAQLSVEQWVDKPRVRNETVMANVRATGDDDLDRGSWEKTCKELEAGYCELIPAHEVDMDTVCVTGRFPKWELKASGKWAVRNISNWKESGGNAATALKERYTPEDLTGAQALTRTLNEVFGGSVLLQGYRVDYSMAFRQDPTDPSQIRMTLEATWNPESQRAEILEVFGQPFGGKGSQFNFIRDPTAMVHAARVLLGVLVCHYSDDTWGIEPEAVARQGYDLWMRLNALVGWRVDEEKSPPPERVFQLLGGELHVGAPAPFATNTAARLEKLEKACRRHLEAKRLTASDASHLAGALGFANTFLWGRVGAAILRPLRVRQHYHGKPGLNPAIRKALEWWVEIAKAQHCRPIPFSPQGSELHITITDGEGTGWLGLIYFKRHGARHKRAGPICRTPGGGRGWPTRTRTSTR